VWSGLALGGPELVALWNDREFIENFRGDLAALKAYLAFAFNTPDIAALRF
jgi:hypothetical protein